MTPEALASVEIDRLITAAGWHVCAASPRSHRPDEQRQRANIAAPVRGTEGGRRPESWSASGRAWKTWRKVSQICPKDWQHKIQVIDFNG